MSVGGGGGDPMSVGVGFLPTREGRAALERGVEKGGRPAWWWPALNSVAG